MLSHLLWLSINGKYCDILNSKPALPANVAHSLTKHMQSNFILHFLLQYGRLFLLAISTCRQKAL